ncbi:uncharacterized protein KY384_002880 [Bacidia gigantensis]|uniref:uncharacterized protein n=1 Tax=Bacidia gigantensis TaxID=2732470 RepID=UPI001D03F9AD|nr:uncharacterized protein KY384_002880 [Bacidia gigantensis]KAG8532395.1 hypothetical protein KY384_002880 [Bacidia gigantensis]
MSFRSYFNSNVVNEALSVIHRVVPGAATRTDELLPGGRRWEHIVEIVENMDLPALDREVFLRALKEAHNIWQTGPDFDPANIPTMLEQICNALPTIPGVSESLTAILAIASVFIGISFFTPGSLTAAMNWLWEHIQGTHNDNRPPTPTARPADSDYAITRMGPNHLSGGTGTAAPTSTSARQKNPSDTATRDTRPGPGAGAPEDVINRSTSDLISRSDDSAEEQIAQAVKTTQAGNQKWETAQQLALVLLMREQPALSPIVVPNRKSHDNSGSLNVFRSTWTITNEDFSEKRGKKQEKRGIRVRKE